MKKKEDYSEEKEMLRKQIKKLANNYKFCESMTALDSNVMRKVYCLLKVDSFISSPIFKISAISMMVSIMVYIKQIGRRKKG